MDKEKEENLEQQAEETSSDQSNENEETENTSEDSENNNWSSKFFNADAYKQNHEQELAKYKDQVLRALAETENVRARMSKQAEESSKFAISSFAKDLVDVMENLYRAIESVSQEKLDDNADLKIMFDGVELTQRTLLNVFDKYGLKRIKPMIGDQFDHNLHQAIAHIDAEGIEPGTVAQVIQAGYSLHERLIRPAMVAVSKS